MTMLLALVLAAAPLQLSVGTQQLLDAPRVLEASTDAPTRLGLRLVGDQLLLEGLEAGSAVLRYRTAKGLQTRKVEVLPFDADAKLRATRARLKDAPGAVTWLEGTCVAIDCSDCSDAEEAVVASERALQACVHMVNVIAPGDPDACFFAAMETLGTRDGGTPELKLHRVGAKVVVTGTVRTADERARLDRLLERCPTVRLGVLGR